MFRPAGYEETDGPVAQLDRALPSEGKGRTFESSRVRQSFQGLKLCPLKPCEPRGNTRVTGSLE